MLTILLTAGDYDINLLAELLKQSPLIGLLGFISVTQYKKQNETEKKVDALRDKHQADMLEANERLEGYITGDRERMITALNNNTAAWQELKEALEKK